MDSNDSKRPNAALINRDWYQAAAGVLPADGLGRVLVAACEYVLNGSPGNLSNQIERAVFQMVLPSLDSDLQKYADRCVRNAANARRGAERVATSGSEWERVGANTTTTSTTTTTTAKTLSQEVYEISRERQMFLLSGYFFAKGSEAPVEEMYRFWNYYEQLGWKNNKGAPIVRKQAAAAMWKCEFALGVEREGSGIWFDVWSRADETNLEVWSTFRSIVRADDTTAHLRCNCKPAFFEWLQAEKMPILGAIASRLGVKSITFGN